MRRKIYLASFFIVLFLAGIFIWRLDIPNWKKLDISSKSIEEIKLKFTV